MKILHTCVWTSGYITSSQDEGEINDSDSDVENSQHVDKIEVDGEELFTFQKFLSVRYSKRKGKKVKELKVLWRNGDITWEEEQSLRETVNDDVDEFLNNKNKKSWWV